MPTKSIKITDFRGPAFRLEATDIPISASQLALNCEYNPGYVGTRAGFGLALTPSPLCAITSMFNWVRNADVAIPTGNALAYFDATTTKARLITNLATGTVYDLFTDAGAYAASFASGGSRLYACAFDTAGQGTAQARVVGTDVAAIYIDKAFMGPMTYKPTLTNSATAGDIGPGERRVGYIVASRTGFMGKISPVSGNTFDTTSIITTPGGKKLDIAFNATWPTEAATVYPVMTTADNPAQFFIIPGSSFGVPGGQAYAFTATVSISDDDLKASGQDVTQNLNLLTQDSGGLGPFFPFLILEYGQRMMYFTSEAGLSKWYVSDYNPEFGVNPQGITADQHVRFLPGYRSVATAFVLDNVVYVLGPHWTFAERDNLQLPVQWPAPELVDGQIGALGPLAATVNSSKGMAWVADSGGLYIFSGGRYSARPVSYMVEPDWKKINLTAGYTVQVKDHKDKQCVYVVVPMATETDPYPTAPNRIMMFDYSNGIEPEEVKYSLWDLDNYDPAAIEIVQNQNTRRLELWVGRGTAGKILRQMNWADDGNPHADDDAPIDWQFETALLPGMNRSIGAVYRHYGAHLRVKGYGVLNTTVYGMDRRRSTVCKTIMLEREPAVEYFRRFALNSESASLRFTMNENAFDYCILSALEYDFGEGPRFR